MTDREWTDSFPDVRFEVLLARDVHADGPALEPFRLHLVTSARHCGDDDIAQGQTFLQREVGGVDDVGSMIFGLFGCGRSFCVFLDGVDVD